ncbi:glycerate kinase [Parasphingorhabdus pacifica]
MTTVLIAPDKFKGSLTADEVCGALSTGLLRYDPGLEVRSVPIADGGDGTVAAAVAAGYTEVRVVAGGPTGEPLTTTYARSGERAVVELAGVSGLSRLSDGVHAPLTATSRGVGEVIDAAVEAGCRDIVLGIGGSASTDGGAGLVRALGARLLDAAGEELGSRGSDLSRLDTVELGRLAERLRGVRITVACDVDNPLTGPRGAAAVYGPQKGASVSAVAFLDAALSRWADVVAMTTGRDVRAVPGAGAAGGVGFAALALIGAELRPGIELVLELVGLRRHLGEADLVITGEGSLDEQTLHGKAPAGVAESARKWGVPVVAVCGQTSLLSEDLRAAGIRAAYALTDIEPDRARCMTNGATLLDELGERIAGEHLNEHGRSFA